MRKLAATAIVAALGILALVGMIAKHAVILIEQIEGERRAGREVRDAVIEASSSRFRPIMLTASSTVLGLMVNNSAIRVVGWASATSLTTSSSRGVSGCSGADSESAR